MFDYDAIEKVVYTIFFIDFFCPTHSSTNMIERMKFAIHISSNTQ